MRDDIINKKFGKLTVLKYSKTHIQPSGQKKAIWLCECDCGNKIEVSGSNLKKKSGTVSCGCYKKEYIQKIGLNNKKEYTINVPEYYSWVGMKTRCYNSKTNYYKDYGGRGIKVCDRWLNSYENFLKDMGKKPGPEYSIDRINVNGNYEPTNCRWATPKEQILNRRK